MPGKWVVPCVHSHSICDGKTCRTIHIILTDTPVIFGLKVAFILSCIQRARCLSTLYVDIRPPLDAGAIDPALKLFGVLGALPTIRQMAIVTGSMFADGYAFRETIPAKLSTFEFRTTHAVNLDIDFNSDKFRSLRRLTLETGQMKSWEDVAEASSTLTSLEELHLRSWIVVPEAKLTDFIVLSPIPFICTVTHYFLDRVRRQTRSHAPASKSHSIHPNPYTATQPSPLVYSYTPSQSSRSSEI